VVFEGEAMKIYELKHGQKFTLEGDTFEFVKIDGAYAQCLLEGAPNEVVLLWVGAEVEAVE
jgi:Lhr-like helicase